MNNRTWKSAPETLTLAIVKAIKNTTLYKSRTKTSKKIYRNIFRDKWYPIHVQASLIVCLVLYIKVFFAYVAELINL